MPRGSSASSIKDLYLRLLDHFKDKGQAQREFRWLYEHSLSKFKHSDITSKLKETGRKGINSGGLTQDKLMLSRMWRNASSLSEDGNLFEINKIGTLSLTWLRQAVSDRIEEHKPLQPETEEWVAKLSSHISSLLQKHDVSRKIRILDLCVGTGCISLSLASRLPAGVAEIVGVDISPEAVLLADENLSANESLLNNNSVSFYNADINCEDFSDFICKKLTTNGNDPTGYDIVVANPPYVTFEEYCSLEPDVKDWEDPMALVPNYHTNKTSNNNGLDIIKRILSLAGPVSSLNHASIVNNTRVLAPAMPTVVIEIGGSHQVPPIKDMIKTNGFSHTDIWKDFSGNDRVVLGFMAKQSN
ncbi:hypothetical protein H4219_001565 [Mycoemilia scoparia]|uniref:Methyltransferase domain-containing protein n=1 Tax=Mycoemilia scoparia TaxID=417184 RepID=A0A9W8DVW3_9FUNG|nr:hypothetical protein H4219_001565 [Mycoemilia scoparia]